MPVEFPFPSPFAAAVRRGRLTVFIDALEIEAGIGVHDHEHGRLQTLRIDVRLDLADVVIERLADTIDYVWVADRVREIAAEGHVGLVETFAERVAMACLGDTRVAGVHVRVEKPGALPGARAPGCEVAYVR